ncbi:MAG TPA: hypothetical protein VF060_31565 [Trebonia sp.]
MTTDDQPRGTWWEPPAPGSGDFGADIRRAVLLFAAGLVGSAVLGLLAGLVWGELAPRALLQEVGAGEAAIVNAETRAFIGADAWFCGIAVVAGLLTGILGYRFLIARRGGASGGHGAGRGEQGLASRAAAVTGLILGALAGALVMMWIGGQIGLSSYTHELASSRNGTMFNASLTLGAKSALAFWPLLTSAVILIGEWSSHRTTPPQA